MNFYLIQRGKFNRYGEGLTGKAGVIDLDYMGSAEFEFGAIPRSFRRIMHNFENYDFRMYFCYSQIFLEVFSCLWTLTASLLIALKLYDIIVNKNRIFKYNSFMSKNAHFISIAVPLILSYIFWAIHLGLRANFWDLDGMYVNKVESGTQSARMIFCWLNKGLSIPLAVIVFLLILGNLYFSVFKGFFFPQKCKRKYASPRR